jgi:hypothetical protein
MLLLTHPLLSNPTIGIRAGSLTFVQGHVQVHCWEIHSTRVNCCGIQMRSNLNGVVLSYMSFETSFSSLMFCKIARCCWSSCPCRIHDRR